MVKIKIILSILIFTSTISGVHAQSAKLDSLENLLEQHLKEDTIRVNLLNEIAYLSRRSEPEKSLSYVEEALELGNKLNFKKGKALSFKIFGLHFFLKSDYPVALEYYQKALKIGEEIGDRKGIAGYYNNIGVMYKRQGNYPMALDYYQQSLKIKEEIGDRKGIAAINNNIGVIHYSQGNYPLALDYYQKALKIKEEIGDRNGIALSLNNIGIIHYEQGNYPMALDYYQKALEMFEELGNKVSTAASIINIGSIHYEQDNYSLALEYLQKSLKMTEELGDKSGIAIRLHGIGDIYLQQDDYVKALDYFQKSLKIRIEIDDKEGIGTSFRDLGSLYLKKQNYTKALSYTLKSLKIAEELEALDELKELHQQLAGIYEATQDYKLAYQNYVQYKQLNDSIFNVENIKKITGLEYQYEFDKEKQAIQLEQEKKDALLAAEAKRQGVIRNSFIAGFSLMILLVLVVLRSYLSKKNTNSQLGEKNEELSALNLEKNNLIGIVAHDLKNPLTNIITSADLIINSTKKIDQENQKLLEIIKDSGLRLTGMISKILNVKAIEQRFSNIKLERINLSEAVKSVSKQFENQAKAKQLQLHTDIASGVMIQAENTYIPQVLENLISNAIKFSPVDKNIFVNLSSKNGVTQLEVRDEGPGLTDKDKQKLFGKFQKLSAQPTGDEDSTGLGLSIVKNFVEAMKGKIWCESDYGKGASFFVSFDLAA